MENEKKVLLSGIQPSGELHLGNYLGAIKNWAELSDQFDCYWFMADLHTITVRQDPAALQTDPGPDRDLYRLRSGSGEEYHFCPVPCERSRRTGLGAGLLYHVRGAFPYDPV